VLDGDQLLRVLHCLWSGAVGGLERVLYQLVREQRRDPVIEPAVLFAQDRGPYVDAVRSLGVPVIALDVSRGYSASALGLLASSMRPYHLHHFHAAEPLLMAASMRCRDAHRVFTQHAGLAQGYPLTKRVRLAMTGAMLRRRFDALSGCSRYATLCAAKLYGIDAGAFRVTQNGLEFDLLEPKRMPQEVREELGLETSDFVLGTTANLKRWKRIDRLLEAGAALRGTPLRVLIVGDGEDRPRLERLAAERKLGDRAVFAGMREDIGDYLQVMDALCLPSTGRETFGMAAVEAMALGIPTIVFADGGGMVDHIDPGETGFVVANQDELESTLRGLLAEPTLGKRIGERGRDAVRGRYTLAASAQAHKGLYAEALSHDGRWVAERAVSRRLAG
jgi:glycosyltransferase involved in cell wall biosynthesis